MTDPQRAARDKLFDDISQHDYPSWPNLDEPDFIRGKHGWTSDCRYGCGAWMGGFCSGRGDAQDAFGSCPNAPEPDEYYDEYSKILYIKTPGVISDRPGMSGFLAPELGFEFVTHARAWTIDEDGNVERVHGDSKLGAGR